MATIEFPYGNGALGAEFSDDRSVELLTSRFELPLDQAEAAVADAITHPASSDRHGETSRGIEGLAAGARDAVVVVSDITRPVPYRTMLPPLLAALERAGVPPERTSLLVATGLHRASTDDERVRMFGARIAADYTVHDHDARDRAAHVRLGTTALGTPVAIDRRYVDAELRIVTSLVEPHLMAGYSGGRKAICPGLASAETIGAVHGAAMLARPGVETTRLDDNPLHRDLLEAARMAGAELSVNVTIDRARRLTGVFAGGLDSAHRAACRAAQAAVTVNVERPAEIVVTTSAGAPLDATFYQAIKGIVAAAPAVRPGGSVILVAECAEGLGGAEFAEQVARFESPESYLEKLHATDGFEIDQWQLQMLCRVATRARIVLVSDRLDAGALEPLAIAVTPSLDRALEDAYRLHGPSARVIALPEGPYLAPTSPEK